jgi:cold-inducible RNA-binding protein
MRLRVQNIPPSMTDDDLRALFEPYGEVLWVELSVDEVSGQPRGFAFLEIRSRSDAEAAVAAVNGRQIQDHTLSVTPADTGAEPGPGSKSDSQSRRHDSRRKGGRRGGKFQGGWGF